MCTATRLDLGLPSSFDVHLSRGAGWNPHSRRTLFALASQGEQYISSCTLSVRSDGNVAQSHHHSLLLFLSHVGSGSDEETRNYFSNSPLPTVPPKKKTITEIKSSCFLSFQNISHSHSLLAYKQGYPFSPA